MEYRPEFIENMNNALGGEAGAFFDALDMPPALALRINPKREGATEAAAPFTCGKVPWEDNGFYLLPGARPGLSVFHAAGAYYLQEASAMLPAALLGAEPGEKVLDLCAAPGGKSGQIAAALKGRGLLVANEPDAKRARMLYGNLERLGVTNAAVLNEYPDRLVERFEGFFDRILVDAPCSGEGMFRREPASRLEWQKNSPEGCAKRQRAILSCAARMLRPGGTLVYSTCTYNNTEDEGVAEWFLSEFQEFEAEDYAVPGVGNSVNGMIKIWPHLSRGDGQFAFRAIKKGEKPASEGKYTRKKPGDADKLSDEMKNEFGFSLEGARPFLTGGTLWAVPEELPDMSGIKTVSYGLQLGFPMKNRIEPAHALAMSGLMGQSFDADEAAAREYLLGNEIPCDKKGWLALTCKGMPLGLGKASGGRLKNHLPKGLRLNQKI